MLEKLQSHSGHRREIEDESTPLGRHFGRCGYDNFSIQMIDCVKPGEDEAIFIVEGIYGRTGLQPSPNMVILM